MTLKDVYDGMGIAKPLAKETRMPLARITRPGLTAIAVSVGLLWGCALGERVLMRKAVRERAQVMRQVVRKRPPAEPVMLPSPARRQRLRLTAG
jgi:hypothetical protein